jgi:hypothetical protein
MDRSNIVPIARTAQETTASQRRHFRVLVAVLVAAWAAVVIAAVTLTPLPPLVPFAILAVLVILAEHRFVLFGDETSMSGSMIVIVASVFVFADTAPLAGPVLIASLGGLYFPHLRARAWNHLFFNVSSFGLSAAAAVAVSQSGWGDGPNLQDKLGIAICATVIYWIANNLIVSGHQRFLHGRPFVSSALTLVTSDLGVLLLTAMTAFIIRTHDTSRLDSYYLIALSLVASGILERYWQSAMDFLERLNRQWGPLMIWAGITTTAWIADSLSPSVIALALVTALFSRHAGAQHHGVRHSALFATAAIVAFAGWALALLIFLAWGTAVRQHLQKWTPWTSALLLGVLATSLSFAALDLSSALSTAGSTITVTLSPWIVSSVICIAVVIASRRGVNGIVAAGLAFPTKAEALFVVALILTATFLAGSLPIAVGIGTFTLFVRTYSRFSLRESAVTASR